jgi:hypothetical protein
MTGDAFDDEILETAVARRPALSALAAGPRHRRELQAELDVSKTTCHRIVSTFDEYGLLRRTDDGYELTAKGKLLETYVDEYYRYVRTTFLLEPLVTAFEESDAEFDVELFADARITRAGLRRRHRLDSGDGRYRRPGGGRVGRGRARTLPGEGRTPVGVRRPSRLDARRGSRRLTLRPRTSHVTDGYGSSTDTTTVGRPSNRTSRSVSR